MSSVNGVESSDSHYWVAEYGECDCVGHEGHDFEVVRSLEYTSWRTEIIFERLPYGVIAWRIDANQRYLLEWIGLIGLERYVAAYFEAPSVVSEWVYEEGEDSPILTGVAWAGDPEICASLLVTRL